MKQKMYKWLLLFTMTMGVMNLTTAFAQCPVTLHNGNGTSGNARAPMGNYRYERSVYLITASEIAAAGIPSGINLGSIGWVYSTAASVSVSGNLTIYMENTSDLTNTKSTTWTTAIGGMTNVYSSAYNLPGTPVTTFDVTLSTPFTYTGGGLYVAFEWNNPGSTSTSCVVSCNTNLTNGLKGGQSNISLPATLASSSFRPVTRVAIAAANDASVNQVYTLGSMPVGFTTNHVIEAKITNNGSNLLTGLNVSLNISGANSFTDVYTIPSLASCASTIISFNAFTPTATGANIVSVSVPNDDNNLNNSISMTQPITSNLYSYKYAAPLSGGVGFNPGIYGVFVSKFNSAITGQINEVKVDFQASSASRQFRIAIYDELGGQPNNLLYVSPSVINISSAAQQSFIPISPAVSVLGNFFVGVVQETSNTVNIGFSYQTENPVRDSTFYYANNLTGGPWTDFSPAAPFRSAIEVQFYIAQPPNCPIMNSPADLGTACINGTTLNWASGGGGPLGYKLTFGNNAPSYDNILNDVDLGNVTSYSTGALAAGTYGWKVTAYNNDGTSSGCTFKTFTADLASCYCIPNYSSGTGFGDYISLVEILTTTLNNPSTGAVSPYYTLYPQSGSTTATLVAGSQFTINLAGGTWSDCYIRGWIDFNQDGSFSPSESIGITGNVGSLTTLGLNFTVPNSALTGTTRMRVRSSDSSPQPLDTDECTLLGYGETEDYLITIEPATCISAPIYPANSSFICPDPGLVLSWPSMTGATGYDVYFDNVSGTTLVSPNQSGTTYNPGTLSGTGPFYWKVVPLYPSATCNTPPVWSFSLNPEPLPLASSGGDVCEGGTIALTGDNLAPGQMSGNSFAWTGPNGFNSTNQYPTISNAGGVNAGTYTLVVTNQYGCSAADSTIINVNPNPTLTIIDYQDVGCIGGSDGEVTIGASGGTANYDFTINFVNYINDPAQATFTNLPVGTTVVTVSDANACQSTIPVTLTYISATPPTQNVIMPFSGMPGNACPGTTANLSIPAVAGATMYTWDGPPGTTFDGNPSPYISTSPSATIVFGTPNTSLYSIGVQAGNGCGNSLRKIQKVRYSVSVPSAVNGDATVCANTSGKVYSIPSAPEGATSYLWTITGDASINGQGNSATTSSLNVTIDFGPSWNGGTLCVAAQTSCYTSATKCLAIGTASGSFGIITGSTTACPNTNETYAVTAGAGIASYNWTVPTNTSINSGQGTNSMNLNFNPSYNNVGNICVTATSICGVVSAPKCRTVAPGVAKVPASISGITNGLCSGLGVAYSTPLVPGVTSYNWTVTGGSIASGQGSNSISVDFGSFTTGQVCVSATNGCGTSASRCVTIKGSPSTPLSITASPSSWCANDAGIVFTADVSNVTGTYTLSWAYPNTTTYVMGGGNTTSLTLDWGASNGVVMVTASNSCGNATRTYTSNISCREGEMSASALNVYPNPTEGMLNVEYTTEKGTAQVTVLDLSGRVVMTQTQSASEGRNTMQLDLSRVAKGAYMLNVQTQSGNNQVRIVVE